MISFSVLVQNYCLNQLLRLHLNGGKLTQGCAREIMQLLGKSNVIFGISN